MSGIGLGALACALLTDTTARAESLPEALVKAYQTNPQLNAERARQRDVLQSIAVDSASIKDTAAKFSMTEGAVRVALHRGLSSLTAKLRDR